MGQGGRAYHITQDNSPDLESNEDENKPVEPTVEPTVEQTT